MRSNAPRDPAPPVCLRSLPWERSKPAFEVPLVFDPKVSCLRLCSIVVSRCLLSDERNGTIGRMCAGQVPRADQKFAGDFTTGEFERSFESPYPLVQLEISLFIEPIFEGSKFHLQCFDSRRSSTTRSKSKHCKWNLDPSKIGSLNKEISSWTNG